VRTDRTVPNNEPDILIRNAEKGKCMLIDVAISEDRHVLRKEAEKILKYKDLALEIQRMRNVKLNVLPVNNTGKWNDLKIIQKITEQYTGKARNQGTTENSRFGHITSILESTYVKVQYQ
jgi:hypothetical protein